MAWNQPSGPNNPWGRRPGQGGPDLDERLKSWQRRLESLLRPGGRGGEGGSLFLMGTLVVLGLWLWSGFYQVAQAERGIIQRFGRLVDVKSPGVGWRWPWPIETVTKVNVASVNSSDFKSRVLTSDVNLVDVQLADAVIPSQRDANKAQADKERFILESEAYANGIVPVAQGAALRMQQDAQAYKAQVMALAEGQASRFAQLEAAYSQSPEVTRRRLYMDTVENVLSRAHKVLIDTRAGGNMIYLPIDKLLEKSTARESEQAEAPVSGAPKEQDITVEARGRGER